MTEVADFTEAEFAAMNAAYESAIAGGPAAARRIDHEDGSWTLLDSSDDVIGFGMSAPQKKEHLSRPGQQGVLKCQLTETPKSPKI